MTAVSLELRIGSSLVDEARSPFLVDGVARVWARVRNSQTQELVAAPSIEFRVWNPQGAVVVYRNNTLGTSIPGVYWLDIPVVMAGAWSVVCYTNTDVPDVKSIGFTAVVSSPDAIPLSPPWVDRTSGMTVFPDNQPVEAVSVLDLPEMESFDETAKLVVVTPNGVHSAKLVDVVQLIVETGAVEAGASAGEAAGEAAGTTAGAAAGQVAGEEAALAAVGAAYTPVSITAPTALTTGTHAARLLVLTGAGNQISVTWAATGAGFACTLLNLTSYWCLPSLNGFTEALLRDVTTGIRPNGIANLLCIGSGDDRLALLTGDVE